MFLLWFGCSQTLRNSVHAFRCIKANINIDLSVHAWVFGHLKLNRQFAGNLFSLKYLLEDEGHGGDVWWKEQVWKTKNVKHALRSPHAGHISLIHCSVYLYVPPANHLQKYVLCVTVLKQTYRISQLHRYSFIPIACAFLETKCLDLPAVITASNLAFLKLFNFFNPLNSHDKVCYQFLLCSKAAHTEMTLNSEAWHHQ